MISKDTLNRKKAIEDKLARHGINDCKIQYLPYLDFDPDSFAKPFDVGCRIMILFAVAFAAHNEEDRPLIITWLKNENIWEHVSPREAAFLEGKVTDRRAVIDFSWKIEAAYVLAWALGLVSTLPEPSQPISGELNDEFLNNLPELGDELSSFLSGLTFIDKTEIIDENLFNELVTTHFRDAYFSGAESGSDINRTVSFERHIALNWLRRFANIEEWDETDTST